MLSPRATSSRHLPVNFRWRRMRIDARANQLGFAASVRGKIALVRNAHNGIARRRSRREFPSPKAVENRCASKVYPRASFPARPKHSFRPIGDGSRSAKTKPSRSTISPAVTESPRETSAPQKQTCGIRRSRRTDPLPPADRASSSRSNRRPANRRSSLSRIDARQIRRKPAGNHFAASCRVSIPHSGKTGVIPHGAAVSRDRREYLRETDRRRPRAAHLPRGLAPSPRPSRCSYISFEHGDGIGTFTSGKPAAAACISSNSSRTACIATRSMRAIHGGQQRDTSNSPSMAQFYAAPRRCLCRCSRRATLFSVKPRRTHLKFRPYSTFANVLDE